MDFPTFVNGAINILQIIFGITTLIFSYMVVWRTAWFANSANNVPPWGRLVYQITVFFLIAFALNFAPAFLMSQTTQGLARTRDEQVELQAELDYWVQDLRPSPYTPTPGVGDVVITIESSDGQSGGGGAGTGGGSTPTPQVIIVTATLPPTVVPGNNGEVSPPTATPLPPTQTPTPVIPTSTPTVDPSTWNVLTPVPPPATATPNFEG